MIFVRKDNFTLRQIASDKADIFEDSLRRNYAWRISSEKIEQRRVIYEEELYQRLIVDFERSDSPYKLL